MYWLCNQISNNDFRTIWYFQQICKGYIQSNNIIKLVFVFKAKANPLKSLAKPTKDLYNRNKCENYINISIFSTFLFIQFYNHMY